MHVVGEVAGDVGPYLSHGERRGPSAAEQLAVDDPQPERRLVGRTREPGPVVVGGDVVHHDPLVAERRSAQRRLERLQQRPVAAPVDRERLLGRRGGRGVEVGDHVAAPEGVDRLLGVADQHHPGVTAEGTVEHLPLHRVGVLELVDQHHLPPLPHPRPGGGVLLLERLGELAEQVVVGQDPEPPLAPFELGPDGLGEGHPTPVGRAGLGAGRLEPGLRVADRGARDRERLGVGERGALVGERERTEVEVVDHLHQQVVEVLDQGGAGVGVAGHAERAQHQRAELVGGGDRRRVERRQRGRDPPVPIPSGGGVALEQQPEQLGLGVVLRRGVAGQRPLGLHQLGPHPLPQLLAGRAAERDDQHLVEHGLALGHEPGHQRADGPGLAGAGAGLQDGGAGRQRASDVEGLHRAAHRIPTFSTPVSSGCHTRQEKVSRPASSSVSTGAWAP